MGIMVVAFCLVWKGTDCDLKTGSDAAFCAAVVGAVYLPRGNYFSPVPQAEPHAAGLGSGFSSPAPHADPHAPWGFSVSLLPHR